MAAGTMRRPRLTDPFVSPLGGRHKAKRPVSAARLAPGPGDAAAGMAPTQPTPRGRSGVLGDPSCGQGSAMAGGRWGSGGASPLAGCCLALRRSPGVGVAGMGTVPAEPGGSLGRALRPDARSRDALAGRTAASRPTPGQGMEEQGRLPSAGLGPLLQSPPAPCYRRPRL